MLGTMGASLGGNHCNGEILSISGHAYNVVGAPLYSYVSACPHTAVRHSVGGGGLHLAGKVVS